jgi:RNA polymerase sigma-70 factor (ECF subfamily)
MRGGFWPGCGNRNELHPREQEMTFPAESDSLCIDERTSAQRIAAGDTVEFTRLMRQHNRRLYRLARSVLRDETEAEDALQDAYLTAYRTLGQFRGDAALSTWLSRLLLNECLGRLRRETRRQKVVPIVRSAEGEMDAVAEEDSARPDRIVARKQLRALIESKLDELPENFRLVFVLRSVEDLSVEETAQTLEIPEATVRSRYFRAKAMLREALARNIDLAERDVFEFGGERCDRIVHRVLSRLSAHATPTQATPKGD